MKDDSLEPLDVAGGSRRLIDPRRSLLGPGMGLLLMAAVPVSAQQSVLDLRFEVGEKGERTYHNLVFSHTLGDSRWSLEAFYLFLPQLDDYDEPGIGAGYRALARGEVSVSLIGFLASAPDDEYFEPALLALDLEGRLTWALFLLHYVPLGEDGIGQWLVDPVELHYRVAGPFSVGISAYLYRPQGGSWLRKIGPKVSLADRLGATELAVRDVNQGGGVEVQLRRIFTF